MKEMEGDEGDIFEDDYDHVEPEKVFYAPQNVPGTGIDPDLFLERISQGCSCRVCDQNCSCLHGTPQNYHPTSKSILNARRQEPIFECHRECHCDRSKCSNRLVQHGPMKGLQVGKIKGKGYGLFCSHNIQAGQFVCEYAGEVISSEEARVRFIRQSKLSLQNYIIFTREAFGQDQSVSTFIVDPQTIGNIGRYLNHSCSPNLIMIPVRIESMVVPHLALFALRDVPVGEELTFDYGNVCSGENLFIESDFKDSDRTMNRIQCECGSEHCRGWLPYNKTHTA